MKKKFRKNISYAIWLDHAKAIIVNRDKKGVVSSETILSEIEPRERFSGETTSKIRFQKTTLNASKKMQNKDHEQMHHYLKNVITHISTEAIFLLIMGPAEAKYDLHRVIAKKKSLVHIPQEIKTTGKLTVDAIAELLRIRISTKIKHAEKE